MIEEIRASLSAQRSPKLVDELLESYQEAKNAFYQGGHRLQAVEGGRFCEAAFRLLQEATSGSFSPFGTTLRTDDLIRSLAGIQRGAQPDSIRLHIPRSLRVVYDIRNNRDTAHLADGIDPNLQDATLVIGVLDWVLAEFLRLWHAVTASEAQDIVETLVTRRAPVIQDFDGFLKVLDPNLTAGEHLLALLYHCGQSGATLEQLREWARPGMRSNLGRTLGRLEHMFNYIHRRGEHTFITKRGIQYVDEAHILMPA
ncbi:MAG TPA: hypothetical protein VMU51_26870 [Mycobacteriales bacterium]|nr:hypothetical protein [Mycobacteriales bacterium]